MSVFNRITLVNESKRISKKYEAHEVVSFVFSFYSTLHRVPKIYLKVTAVIIYTQVTLYNAVSVFLTIKKCDFIALQWQLVCMQFWGNNPTNINLYVFK